MGEKRGFLDSYVDCGFMNITEKGIMKPQCLICLKVLTAQSLKPSKLKQHLQSQHPSYVGRDRSHFERQQEWLKRQRLDSSGSFHQQNAAAVKASYLVSLEIAWKKKPHTIGEELILPRAKTMVRLKLGEKSVEKLCPISLSHNTVKHRICDVSNDIKD